MTSILALAAVAAAAAPAITNPGFDNGLDGWRLNPGKEGMATVEDLEGATGKALRLHTDGATLGIDSTPLVLGRDLDPAQVYRLEARVRLVALERGTAALTACVVDADGKRLAQYAIQSWPAGSKPAGWLRRAALVGPGTDKAYPEGAHALHLRLSFYEPKGDCQGDIWLDDCAITPAPAQRFGAWPASIVARLQDLEVRFESRSFWTLYRIDYQGTRLGRDTFGSHYGTVASVKGVGFIGSGHTENGETEQVVDLALSVDGQPQQPPRELYEAAREVVLLKHSRIRDLDLNTTITVRDSRIWEEVVMVAEKPLDLNLLYHFMHPWVTDMSHYLAEKTDGSIVEGPFVDDKGMKVSAPVAWSAVFSETLGKGAVTVVLETPEGLPWDVRYWDVPGAYRKHYLTVFTKATVEPGRNLRYRIVTVPFAAPTADWKQVARDLAGAAAESPRPGGE
ncbi:MAG: hypothetical protein GX595_13095 [Lentisphaerae bacterium]|nr:hypothetical protein [Lentisphaerota bacterium]